MEVCSSRGRGGICNARVKKKVFFRNRPEGREYHACPTVAVFDVEATDGLVDISRKANRRRVG